MSTTTKRSQRYTTPGAFTFSAPGGVKLLRVSMVAGGSSGNACDASQGGGGGSAGEWCVNVPYAVPAGSPQEISGTVGQGGASVSPPAAGNAIGNVGTESTFGMLKVLPATAPTVVTQSGKGGGYNGGAAVAADTVGNPGDVEAGGNHGGGASGGGGASSAASALAGRGGHALNYNGASAGTPNGAGGGGASSPWGAGGQGGSFGGTRSGSPGTGYGSGGGGTSRSATTGGTSGAGADGMVLIEWEE